MAQGLIVGTPLPGANLPFMDLKRPGPGQGGKIEGWVLSEAIIGIRTHFYDKRTFPCTKHLGGCDGCTGFRRRSEWNGYFAVIHNPTRDKVIFAVSEYGISMCPHLTRDGFVLRGSFAIVQRKGESESGAYRLGFTDNPYPKTLPDCPDVAASLARMWKLPPDLIRRVAGLTEGGEA